MKRFIKSQYFKLGATIFITFSICLIFFTLFKTVDLVGFVKVIISILMPFFIGFAIAYLVNPIVKFFEVKFFKKFFGKRKTYKRLFRALSVTTAMLITLIIITALVVLIAPQLFESIYSLIKNIPYYITNTARYLDTFADDNAIALSNINSFLENMKNTVATYTGSWPSQLPTVVEYLASSVALVVDVVKNLLLGIIISFYVLYNKEKFISQTKKTIFSVFKFDNSKRIISTVKEAHTVFGGFITGVIIDSLIIGIMCFIGVSILRMPYPILIAVIVGVTNIIPFFGPFIGAIPSAFIILMDSPFKVIWFILFILALQQFDGNILKPKILGSTTGLDTFWVLFSILVFGGMFGFLGMFLGVPIFSIIYALLKRLINNNLKKKNLPIDTSAYISSSNINRN